MIQDKRSDEELKEALAKQQISSMQLDNQKKKPNRVAQAENIGRNIVRAIERM